jgi:hypothetical protein
MYNILDIILHLTNSHSPVHAQYLFSASLHPLHFISYFLYDFLGVLGVLRLS